MTLLYLVAFISGFVTIAAPCIWPLLPIVLGSASWGGHRKPFGITLGIITSFGFLTLSISYITRILPIDLNILRLFAVCVIAFLGIALIVPSVSLKLETYLSKLLVLTPSKNRNGFLGGFLTGIAIGVVWTPCAGPVLATIAALSITLSLNSQVIILTFFYLLGLGIPLLLFSILGRRILVKTKILSNKLLLIQRTFGIIMVLTAIAIYFNFDKTVEAKLLNYFPSYTNFINSFEGSQQTGLNKIKDRSNEQQLLPGGLFNANYNAPAFDGVTNWLNTKDIPSIQSLKGKVVLIDFWTYTCINCIRTLPYVTKWYDSYKDKGFVVIGVHTPEFEFEKDTTNVEDAIKRFNIHYPVAQDNNYSVWNNYSNKYWPAEYLIDANGIVRRTHFGEGEYDQMEQAIVQLLNENGAKIDVKKNSLTDQTPTMQISPETYLGLKGTQYSQFYPSGLSLGISDFNLNEDITDSEWSFGGKWNIQQEYSETTEGSQLSYNFTANKVFLVLKPSSKEQKVKVFLDGKLVDNSRAGSDVKDGVLSLDEDRLYSLLNLKETQNHILRLEFDKGIDVFAFTFG